MILINSWQITFSNISVNKENYISVDSRRVFLQDRTTFITQKRQAWIQMADFSIFLGNHVRPITDPLTLRFLLFVIHNQKDLN